MKAATYDRYGPPEVLHLEEVDTPKPKVGEMLIKVRAAAVTTGDWRVRSLEMPGSMRLLGRLMFGIFRPRNRILGGDIAGDVADVGEGVEGFKPGDPVFGHIGQGGHADFAVAKADGAMIPKPDALSYAEAAALPFGALCALVFLRDFARLRVGQRVLIVGASGNVGVYAVQIAKALGAHVTAVASGANEGMVRDLGADDFIDYREEDVKALGPEFDVVFDTYGLLTFREARKVMTEDGKFLPLNFTLGGALWNMATGWIRRQKMITAVNGDTRDDLNELLALLEAGKLRPVVDTVFPFEDVRAAYVHVEGRRRRGSVIVEMGEPAEFSEAS